MTTPILGIREIANNQQNQYITANEAFRALESASNDFLLVDFGAGDVTLTQEQFTASYAFLSTGNSAARNLNIPASKRAFVVINGGTAALTVVRGASTIEIPVDNSALLLTDGTADGIYGIGGGGASGVGWGDITGDIDLQVDLNTILTNTGISLNATGVVGTNDTVLLQAPNDTTLRIASLAKGLFYNEIDTSGMNDAVKTFPQIDVALSTIPIVTNGLYIFYVSYDSAGAVYFTQGDAGTSNSRLRLGVVFVKRVAGVNSFWDGAAGPRNVLTFPEMAGNNDLVKTYLTLASDVAVLPNANLTVKNTAGTLKGESIGWGTSTNNQKAIAANAVTSFVTLNPSITSQTAFPAAGTAVQTTQYWNGSAMVSTGGANTASVQRFLMTSTGGIILQVGEATYATLDIAVQNAVIAPFSPLFPELTHFTEIARFAVRNAAANLQSVSDAVFIQRGGGTSGGAASLGTMAIQNANAVAISGGNIDSTTIGAITPAPGTFSALTSNGNLNFTGTGRRISGEMSSGTLSDNLTFQSSTLNGNSIFGVMPNGTSRIAGYNVYNSSDLNNCSYLGVSIRDTDVRLSNGSVTGGVLGGALIPFSIRMGAVNALAISTAGDVGFGVNSPDTSAKLQTSNGIKLGNTANTSPVVMDWYEEGTFTATVRGTTTAGVATPVGAVVAKYTRKGDGTDFEIITGWSAHTGTGNLEITGLPFLSSPNSTNAVLKVFYDGLLVGAGKELAAIIITSSQSISFRTCDPTGGAAALLPMDTAVNSLRISGHYFH